MSMVLSNVIWPTFITPYVLLIFLPFMGPVIFISEMLVAFKLVSEKDKKTIAKGVAIANIISSLVGALIGFLLSIIPGEMNNLRAENSAVYLFISYLIAFILSVSIEGLVMNKYFKDKNWQRSLYINLTSYGIIAVLWAVKTLD